MWMGTGLVSVAGCLLSATLACAQTNFAPSDVTSHRATVLSEGIALAATVYQHRSQEGKPRPTIILCHGWGGEMAGLKRQATAFAAVGYTVITFDYRGWGESAGRLVQSKPQEPRKDGKPYTTEVVELREIVDPWEHLADITSVLAWAAAQPEVDVNKLGLWGTSYGGGHVLFVAAYDARIKAVVAQVGSFDDRRAGQTLDRWRGYATQRTKGELPYPPPQSRTPGKLHGHPMIEHMLYYAPVEQAGLVRADQAVLIIAAENEELMDNRQHSQRAYERLQGPKNYIVISGITHYDVYGKAFEQATRPAIEWYEKYLK